MCGKNTTFASAKSRGEVLEWLKRHAWKACKRQKRFGGSNPPLSAEYVVIMKRLIILFSLIGLLCITQTAIAQDSSKQDTVLVADSAASAAAMSDSLASEMMLADELDADTEEGGFHKQLKTKFIDGNVGFMSLVALALVLGLAFCIERIIYLTLSEIKARKLMEDIENRLQADDVEGAKTFVPKHPWSCGKCLLSGTSAYQSAYGCHRAQHYELRRSAGRQS